MTDIFDAERARRLTLLRQSSVSNRIRLNPDTASFLRRYEDSDVSRLKLLEAQRLRNESEEQSKLIKLQKKRLKKRLRSGKGLPKGRGKQQKEVIQKSPLEVEIEKEKERAAQKLERDKLRVVATTETLRDRQERDRLQQEGLLARARLQQTAFDNQAARQNAQNIFLGNRAEQQAQRAQQLRLADRDQQARIDDRQQQLLIADAQREDREEDRQARLAIADISERRLAADSADLRRLNADKLRIKQLQIDNHFQDNQQERALRDRQLAGERERYNVDLARVQADREREVGRVNAELEGVRERVARDDAFRHRQLEEQQRLALEQLAQQRRDNSQQSELERNRIDNQRAVDAERAITDRELIQGFSATVQALNTQRDSDPTPAGPPAGGPTAADIAAQVRQDLAAGLRAGARAASPQPRQSPVAETAETSSSGSFGIGGGSPVDLEDISQTGSELAEEARRAAVEGGTRVAPDDTLTSAQIFEGIGISPPAGAESLRLSPDRTGRAYPAGQGTASQAGATARNLAPRRQSSSASSQSSGDSDEQRMGDDTQRTLSVMRGGSSSPTPRVRPGPLVPSGRISERTGREILAPQSQVDRSLRAGTPPRTTRSRTPPRSAGTPALTGSGRVDTIAEESTLQQVGGAVGGVVSGAARLAGGAIGGVGQGIYEQLPSAGDVGAAVGRGGVRAVSGVAGAVYEGLVGGQEEDEPIDRQGSSAGQEIYDTLRRQEQARQGGGD